MSSSAIIVAGHCCLDIIPAFSGHGNGHLVPGALVDVGPAVLAPGGTVSNVGLALQRLGMTPRLMGKVGDDPLGRVLLDLYRAHDPALAEGMIVAPGEPTSYSIVISPPGQDRIFLHCSGANHTFRAADIPTERLDGAQILHFGYPPLMRQMYRDDGRELGALLRLARGRGLFTTLDMALPDPQSEAGQIDWPAFLRQVLPFVDGFMPSIDEILFMLDRPRYLALRDHHAEIAAALDGPLLTRIADQLIAAGTPLVLFKLGDRGLYLRTSAEFAGLAGWDDAARDQWRDRELLAPCFAVTVAGTTGAGDATIAGFLAALLHALPPEDALSSAVAVGACSVEQVDAASGILSWESVHSRIAAGWPHIPHGISLPGWRQSASQSTNYGPRERPRGDES